jgi:hypothetical protein
MWNIQKD